MQSPRKLDNENIMPRFCNIKGIQLHDKLLLSYIHSLKLLTPFDSFSMKQQSCWMTSKKNLKSQHVAPVAMKYGNKK